MVKGAKGRGGKGRGRPSWTREFGSHAYLKNFRKGLRHQQQRCSRELEEEKSAATARELDDRLRWILEKQDSLDNRNEMVWDMPVMERGRPKEFGSRTRFGARRRPLTAKEISWNADLIEDEVDLEAFWQRGDPSH